MNDSTTVCNYDYEHNIPVLVNLKLVHRDIEDVVNAVIGKLILSKKSPSMFNYYKMLNDNGTISKRFDRSLTYS